MATQNGQTAITDKAREIWLAGLGVFSTIEEEGEKLFDKMKEKGQELESKGAKLEKKAKEKIEELPNPITYIEGVVNTTFEKFGVASHKEMSELTEKVDKLTEIVAVLAKKLDSKTPAKKES
ncbi:phasin family protein [candidate division KSB1 bacterium]|nr:phasin family protein [candidate division KSB1 bacterium]